MMSLCEKCLHFRSSQCKVSAFYTVVSYVGHYLTARVIATLCVSFCLFVFSAAVMAAGMLHQRSPFFSFFSSFFSSFYWCRERVRHSSTPVSQVPSLSDEVSASGASLAPTFHCCGRIGNRVHYLLVLLPINASFVTVSKQVCLSLLWSPGTCIRKNTNPRPFLFGQLKIFV